MAQYEYLTPAGYGDLFYQYGYTPPSTLANASTVTGLQLPVDNYDFIARHWAGWETIIDTPANGGLVQAYDSIHRNYASQPLEFGSFPQGQVILPEKLYPVNSLISFDLYKVLKATNSETAASQLVWSGVRRYPGSASDPAPSPFNFKRKRQYYPYNLTVQQAPVASAFYQIQITDFDFELERIELTPFSSPSKFAITLYDSNKVARSNVPIHCLRFCHSDPAQSNGELSFFPAPPILYKVNSAINFTIDSLIGAGGALTFRLNFVGSRRIPC